MDGSPPTSSSPAPPDRGLELADADRATTYSPTCGGTHINGPWGAAWDPTHTWIYIGDKINKRVVRWSPANPTVCQVVTTGADTPEGSFSGPDFLNFSPGGTLYVSDNNKRVYAFSITG